MDYINYGFSSRRHSPYGERRPMWRPLAGVPFPFAMGSRISKDRKKKKWQCCENFGSIINKPRTANQIVNMNTLNLMALNGTSRRSLQAMRLIRENVFKQQKPTLRLQAVLLINTSSNINIQDLGTLS